MTSEGMSLSKQVAEIVAGEFPEESPLEIALRILTAVAEEVERMPPIVLITPSPSDMLEQYERERSLGFQGDFEAWLIYFAVKAEHGNIVEQLRKEG